MWLDLEILEKRNPKKNRDLMVGRLDMQGKVIDEGT